MTIKIGTIIKIKPAFAEQNELKSRYEVTEINGDRLFARFISDLPLSPIELFSIGMIEVA